MATYPRTNRFWNLKRIATTTCAFAMAVSAHASDFAETEVETEFKSGLDRAGFAKAFKGLNKSGYRIADVESYRVGRSAAVSTIWTKLAAEENWQVAMSLPISEFLERHKKHLENGYSLVEFEVDRNGATLHFSGVWLERPSGLDTEFYVGMESLEFSNRYGEMADRGYRLIDFEAYEANGKFRHGGVWLKNEDLEVRFYRAIPKNKFGEVAAAMDNAGFRMLDVEAYNYEGDFVYAAEWVKRSPWQKSRYEFDLMPGEFFNKNATYENDGYRITEFETYSDNGVLYYAGSWLKGNPDGYVEEEQEPESDKDKNSSLERFRTGSK